MDSEHPRFHVTVAQDITDHIHLEIECMDDDEFDSFVDEVVSIAESHGEIVMK